MKKTLLIATVIAGTLFASSAMSQVSLSVNIGTQPQWGPAGYDYAGYYYLPDIDVYYNVPQRQFVYFEGNRWVFASCLPARYNNYDLYSGYKVVINDPRPYMHPDQYREMYAPYRYRHDQVVIRDYPQYRNYGRPDYDDHRHGWEKNRDWRDWKRDRDNDDHDNGHGHGRGNRNW